MLDFRYHALSLVAVFLALGIGILLGVTIGDSLVSEADRGLRNSLREDVNQAREDAADARAGVERREQLIQDSFDSLAGTALAGQRVAIVATGSLPGPVEDSVKEAVEASAGEVDSVSVFALPEEASEIGEAVGGRFGRQTELNEAIGRRAGIAIVRGTGLAETLESTLPERFDGSWQGADAIAFYRSPPSDDESREDRDARVSFESAMITAMTAEDAQVVGIEESRTEPSQVPFYEDRDISSVDSVDTWAGRYALVVSLAGEDGTFGLKDSAERAIPKPEE
jgi:Copper transport outer membrane protein, MctB